MIVSFRTTFKRNGIWVKSGKDIAIRYLLSWFIIDFLSTLPISYMISGDPFATEAIDEGTQGGKLNKLIRLVRLFKLGRLVRLVKDTAVLERFFFTRSVFTVNKQMLPCMLRARGELQAQRVWLKFLRACKQMPSH